MSVAAAAATARRDVLIVGGGIAGVEALLALSDLGDQQLNLHLVAGHPSFVLRPQTLGEPWGGPPLHVDLERLCRAFGVRFVTGTVTTVLADEHVVRTTAGDALAYDRLLLAPGARMALPYAQTRTLGFGALPETLAGSGDGSVAIVIPPGTSWTLPAYELALLSAGGERKVRVVTDEAFPLEVFGPGTRAATEALLNRHGVQVDTGGPPEPGASINHLAGTVIALPLLTGPKIDGVPRDEHDFVPVDTHMGVPGAEHVSAAGDATRHRIKQGGLAGQQADVAAAEIVRSFGTPAAQAPYQPVLRGKLTAPDGEELFLRRHLNDEDEGQADPRPLWQPSGAVCAWRLARWLNHRRGDLDGYTLDHLAQPAHR
ncbi:MAG: hypothetical protein JWN65_4185 [Solirubrobacterales bacterium]|nr:hypothetical protein [Solirubrobacterales bacterium]